RTGLSPTGASRRQRPADLRTVSAGGASAGGGSGTMFSPAVRPVGTTARSASIMTAPTDRIMLIGYPLWPTRRLRSVLRPVISRRQADLVSFHWRVVRAFAWMLVLAFGMTPAGCVSALKEPKPITEIAGPAPPPVEGPTPVDAKTLAAQ